MQNQKELNELINTIMENSKKEEQTSTIEAEKAPATAPVSNQTAESRKEKMAKIKAALANAAAREEMATQSATEQQVAENAPETEETESVNEVPAPPSMTSSKTAEPVPTTIEDTETTEEEDEEEQATSESEIMDDEDSEEEDFEEEDEFEEDEDFEEEDSEEDSVASPLPEEKPAVASQKSGTAVAKKGIPMQLIAAFVGVGLAASAVASYFLVANTYHEKFLPNTYVNAVKIDGMDIAEAEDALIDNAGICEVTFVAADGKKATFSSDQFMGRYFVPSGALTDAHAENPYQWVKKLFNPTQYNVNLDFVYSEPALRQLLTSYDWGDRKSTNAQILLNGDGTFDIEPETLGDEFNVTPLLEYTANQLRLGITTIKMEESGCYDDYQPEITTEDLAPQVDIYEGFSHCNITFDFSDRKKIVDSAMILDWIATDDKGHIITDMNGEVSFDRNKVSAFVAEMADETDTYGKPREFMSTLDGLITVPWDGNYSSNYGWLIDQEATVNQLISIMKEGKSVTVEPEYKYRGYVRDRNDIGDSYVELDISAQHVWVYIDGKIKLSADCVTGTETNPDRRTPRGVCYIWSKEEDRILGTYAVQGYEQFVDYWMPFNYLGCGFHDLSRGAYGGNIYMYNGSHGCCNLSLSVAKQMYELVEVGMPALIHD
ncbi:MAG: L,D-transpeptidase family protein [Oscillospiraceae bacterium]